MASSTSKAEEVTGYVEETPKQQGKVGRHCRRFWWIWLIAFCLFVLVIMIIIVYAILPAVSQKEIDKTVLNLHSFTILEPSPTSLLLSLNSTITGAGGIAAHARLDPMNVSFFLEDHKPIDPFMYLKLPSIKGGSSVPVITTNVTTEIASVSALTEFSALLLGSETLRVAIRGRSTLRAGKLHTKVNYNEVITIKGFNQLKGMEIEEYNLLNRTQQSDGSNLGGKVLIPNPTVFDIQMGDVHINLSFNGQALGNGTIPGLHVRPGNHTYDFRARVQTAALLRLAAAGGGNPVVLDVRGNGTDINGVSIPWLAEPLSSLEVKVPIKARE
ncbi:unnamed protein product [Tuber aestivum]|uniref:Uncharacterized protein n=1 Tax=Tuber aestivum TaxID=59557 RepID=A0A292Q4Z6_9PEZI|nr:unnamed protein product [Tuber aestivum]